MQGEKWDVTIEPLDWRYSAAIVGVYKYLIFHGKKEGTDFMISEDDIKLSSNDITEEKYLQFVEDFYSGDFQHLKIEKILKKHDITEKEKNLVNDILDHGNFILKKIFKKERFNGRNKAKILSLIRRNRDIIVRETFRYKKNMYANYANTGTLFKEPQERCRLWGYYVDGTRKSKADSYNFNAKKFVSEDSRLFDFIPFAFQGWEKTIFINNSFSVTDLVKTNLTLENLVKQQKDSVKENMDITRIFFKNVQENQEFIDYDVEIIFKDKNYNFFQTLYVKQESIRILRKIKVYDIFCIFFKINDHFYLNMQEEVLKCILNFMRTDYLIELCLKRKKKKELINVLIKINTYICGKDEKFQYLLNQSEKCAEQAADKLSKESIEYYRQQFVLFLSYGDYDKCCHILLCLSDDTEVSFDFIYALIEDFEKNKDIAYTFINTFNVGT